MAERLNHLWLWIIRTWKSIILFWGNMISVSDTDGFYANLNAEWRYWRPFLDLHLVHDCHDICLPVTGGAEFGVRDPLTLE